MSKKSRKKNPAPELGPIPPGADPETWGRTIGGRVDDNLNSMDEVDVTEEALKDSVSSLSANAIDEPFPFKLADKYKDSVNTASLAASSPAKAEAIKETNKALIAANDNRPAANDNAPQYEGIAVLGSHPATVQAAPFDDNWLIYACSPHNLEFEAQDGRNPNLRYLSGGTRPDGGKFRVDEWFEVHLPLADATRPYGYLRELEKLELVWMRDKEGLSRIKGARKYPHKELTARFGPFFWTSSIAFIIAKAIVDCEKLGIKQLGIWGVMQASETEYTYQRPGIQYLIQRAMEAGIKVMCPEESKLFEPQQVQF